MDINDKFRITKYISPPKKQKEFPHLHKKHSSNHEPQTTQPKASNTAELYKSST